MTFRTTQSVERVNAPFIRIPPFPGSKLRQFTLLGAGASDFRLIAHEVRRLRVGGTYWGAQPELPEDCVLVTSSDAQSAAERLFRDRSVVLWDAAAADSDPWHMLASASALVADAGDERCLIAGLLEVPCYHFDRTAGELSSMEIDPQECLRDRLCGITFENPFTGEAMNALESVRLCGFWRELIDSNRGISSAFGFAFWKQDHVAPLLWGGSTPVRFVRDVADLSDAPVAVWRAKTPADVLDELAQREVPLVEVEDGFLRSRGLGADCVPPLSITVDRMGAYFDPSQPSELEQLLEDGQFDQRLITRARELRRVIVEAGLGKYEKGTSAVDRPAGLRRHVLVPGQVEDDRAVQQGGCGLVSNLELLKRVRAREPEAFILYKPHPDVLAGHRRGAIPEDRCLEYSDQVVAELPIASAIAIADAVHVNTSLAGFEALLRDKPVTTHGVPFYAGWGLTNDLGPVPARRTARRTIDELAAATLLLYPRYLDPMTGIPCPAEVVVARLSNSVEDDPGMLVGVRRFQGKLMRRLRSLVQ